MKLPRLSMAEMMLIIPLFAIDCLVIRATEPAPAPVLLVFGGSPMQIVLMIGLLRLFGRRRRMEKPSSFLIGFEVAGWISLLIYAVPRFQEPTTIIRHLDITLGPLLSVLFSGLDNSALVVSIKLGLVMAYLTAPQLAAALVGGWISQQWWKPNHPEPASTS